MYWVITFFRRDKWVLIGTAIFAFLLTLYTPQISDNVVNQMLSTWLLHTIFCTIMAMLITDIEETLGETTIKSFIGLSLSSALGCVIACALGSSWNLLFAVVVSACMGTLMTNLLIASEVFDSYMLTTVMLYCFGVIVASISCAFIAQPRHGTAWFIAGIISILAQGLIMHRIIRTVKKPEDEPKIKPYLIGVAIPCLIMSYALTLHVAIALVYTIITLLVVRFAWQVTPKPRHV